MGFKVYARLQGYQVKQIKELFDQDAIEPAVRLTAKHLARVTRNSLRGARFNPPTKRRSEWTGKMMSDIKAQKGKFDDTTWLYGVLGNPSGEWEETTGGRAHFYEYGRSAPGRGRKSIGKPQQIKYRKLIGQPPRPFMRQTVSEGKRKLFGETSKTVTRLTRKIKRGKVPKTIIKRIAEF